MQLIIRARHLQKHFTGFTVVKDVGFSTSRGRCFGFAMVVTRKRPVV